MTASGEGNAFAAAGGSGKGGAPTPGALSQEGSGREGRAPSPPEVLAACMQAMLTLTPVLKALIRRVLPRAVHGRFDTAVLLSMLPRALLEDGFLDLHLEHYVGLADLLCLGAGDPSMTRIVYSFAPLIDGKALTMACWRLHAGLLAVARREFPQIPREGPLPVGGGVLRSKPTFVELKMGMVGRLLAQTLLNCSSLTLREKALG